MMNSVYDLAEEFVQLTGCSVFLTGKAGTGKTTFLRRMRAETHKQMAVVAPTGVAAINAGGVTIHSFFKLPFTPYVPTEEGRRNLIDKQKVTTMRRKIFQELELLVIDEISMVRADVLDAIDAVLRHYRYRRTEPFGGVQVIFIGDMYQLSPVVPGEEWHLLHSYYQTPYFFHSKVLEQHKPIYIELDHIFRQTNLQFIQLLNEVRNDALSPEMYQLLQSRYLPGFRPDESDGYITLTTHNQKADLINQEEMIKIEAKTFTYSAQVKGEFNEKNYPNDAHLCLKVGAKVMFIANDVGAERRYYNGKLGVISHLDEEEILVICDGETEPIPVTRETWSNVRYSVNKETNHIEEEELGAYTQYPLRLAWAITIHKSQGLTFDRVVIDAGSAFASGQVYVALSRCRSLDGIVLTTSIQERSLAVDPNILAFSAAKPPVSELQKQVDFYKQQYSKLVISRVFNMESLDGLMDAFVNYFLPFAPDFGPQATDYWNSLFSTMHSIQQVSVRFQTQLEQLFASADVAQLQQRIAAASDYFSEQLHELLILLEGSPVVTDSRTEATDYRERITNIYEQASEKRYLVLNIRNDISIQHYFQCKADFKVPRLSIKCYAAETKQRPPVKTNHVRLYQALAVLRNQICEQYNMPVYMVASTATLVEISNRLPQNAKDLARIKGFGKVKVQRFGDAFIDAVLDYCREENVESPMQTEAEFIEEETVEKAPKLSTLQITLEFAKQGMSIPEIAQERGVKAETIEKHIEHWIGLGMLPLERFVNFDYVRPVMQALREGKTITEIYAEIDGVLTFGQLRMVRTALQLDEA